MLDHWKIEEFCQKFYVRSVSVSDPATFNVHGFANQYAIMGQEQREVTITMTADQLMRMVDMLDDMDPGRCIAAQEALEHYLTIRRLSREK